MSTAEWPCFELVSGLPRLRNRPVWPYGQGFGSVITEPASGWAKNALQEFETLYIGGAKPAHVRRVQGQDRAESARDCEGSFTTTMALSSSGCLEGVFGVGTNGTSTRLNDE